MGNPYIISAANAVEANRAPQPDAEQARGLGFSHALLRSNLLLQAEDLPGTIGAAVPDWRSAGLKVLLRVMPEVYDLADPAVQSRPESFSIRHAPRWDGPVDPRRAAPPSGRALARFNTPEVAKRLLPDVLQHLERLLENGADGFVFEQPSPNAAGFYTQVNDALRQRHPDVLLVAATPGLSREGAIALAGSGFDALFSSLSWWDFRSRWLVEEHEDLRPHAPLIAQITHDAGRRAASPAEAQRLTAVAAATGAGMVVPQELLERSPESAKVVASSMAQARAAERFSGELQMLTAVSAPATVLIRGETPDLRDSEAGLIALINPDFEQRTELDSLDLSAGCGLDQFAPMKGERPALSPLAPCEVRLVTARRAPAVKDRRSHGRDRAKAAAAAPRLVVEDLSPTVAGGPFPVKRVVGEIVVVDATVYGDGHEHLAAALLYKAQDERQWRRAPMHATGTNDVWRGYFRLERLGRYEFTVEGWLDRFGGYRRDLAKKRDARVAQPVDLMEGEALVSKAADRAPRAVRTRLQKVLKVLRAAPDDDARTDTLLSPSVADAMAEADDHPFAHRALPQPIDAERLEARFSAWYELFPRSQTQDPGQHGTFTDVIDRLPAIRAMGFDTLYFPPIHPIGKTNRKGPNNTLDPAPTDPGSPYAIGSAEGGHDAIHPELGSFEDFRALLAEARRHGLEIALDFAIQCSPDHPWLREHPGWFDWRPDGSIKYAENPPKKYQDIVNVDFYTDKAVPDLWIALKDIVLLWVNEGVKCFRVDNPHTKPFPFWEWMIGTVRAEHPGVIFLAEAFTRPNVMYRLAKIGFSQSYTYFTWRDTKHELTEYIEELTSTAPKDFFRPHFFVNTPDINPVFLQQSGRPGFQIRAVLAATLSGLFGMYSGFELCEAAPIPGKEEYLDSEKYEIRPRDWTAPGNIIGDITLLNRLRRGHPALQTHLNTRFYNAWNDNILYYGKPAPEGREMILVAVQLDPHHAQEADFEVPLWEFGLPDDGSLDVEDLVTGDHFVWTGKVQHMRLDPGRPYRLWRIEPARPRHA